MRALPLVPALLLFGCGAGVPSQPVEEFGCQVVRTYPHDPGAFTQGLLYLDGILYEGTGNFGRSSIRKVKLETGEVLLENRLADNYFGEGIVVWKNKLIELTWQSQKGFLYDRDTFQLLGEFTYPGEGWGLTHDGRRIIMSDGTAELRFWDPETLRETGRLTVRDGGSPVSQLNELEWVKGRILANVWQSDRVASIDPDTGVVKAWIDLSGLLSAEDRRQSQADVLNGIAYDAQGDRLFVTGKNWPKLFEIRLVKK